MRTYLKGTPTAENSVKIVEVNSTYAIDPQQWDELWSHCTDATVFQTRAWIQAWYDVFVESAGDRRLFTAWDGDRLVGLAPLARTHAETDQRHGIHWVLAADDYSDYQTLLCWNDSADIAAAMLEAIDRSLPRWEGVVFREIPEFSLFGGYLAGEAAHRSSRVLELSTTPCPALRVNGNEQGIRRVLGKTSLKRSEKSLRALGELSIQHMLRAEEIEAHLDGLFTQHVRRYAQARQTSLFVQAKNRDFYRIFTKMLAPAGDVVYSAVRIDDRIVSQHLGLRSKTSLLWYKPTFDIDFGAHSPGDVLIKCLIEYADANGLTELDFTRGDEKFKSRFASYVSYNKSFAWYRGRLSRLRTVTGGTAAWLRRTARSKEAPSRLRGAPNADTSKSRVLVLGAEQVSGKDVVRSLARHGVEVHCAAPTAGVGYRFARCIEFPLPEDRELFISRLNDLDKIHDYSLILPCSEPSAAVLSSITVGQPLRSKTMLPSPDALAGCQGQVQLDWRNSAMEATTDGLRLLALYMQGRMISFFVPDTTRPYGQACPRKAELSVLIRRMLDEMQWHGPATVLCDLPYGDDATRVRVVPYLYGSLAQAVRRGLDLPVQLWKIWQGLSVGPYRGARW